MPSRYRADAPSTTAMNWRRLKAGSSSQFIGGLVVAMLYAVIGLLGAIDHLVGAGEHRGRKVEAERLRSFEIDD